MGVVARPLHGVTVESGFQRRYLALVAEIETRFDVAHWRCGDVDVWPLARMDLYLDMHWHHTGQEPPRTHALPFRVAARAARPVVNLWKSRRDFSHCALIPKPAHAILLGDGVSLDPDGSAWRDRFGEPIVAALEKRGLDTFLMQSGNLRRLPWRRPTFAASNIEAWGWLASLSSMMPIQLPDRDAVLDFLERNDVSAPSLAPDTLLRRARIASATASAFEAVLRIVRPKLAFVVTYYAHFGHAFVLACRRQGILSVDLQHAPQEGAHKAYGWSCAPHDGYRMLPAVFWNWTKQDAANIRAWTDRLALPWHSAIHGGHTQITPFLHDDDPVTRMWDAKYQTASAGRTYEREILVALQPIAGQRATWDALAAQIEAAPSQWRWWIRRHPASHPDQDAQFGRLLSLRRPNVAIDQASSLPLPILLRHMDAVVSLSSGAGMEAAIFGVPALFLSDEARAMFPALLATGSGAVIDAADVNARIRLLSASRARLPQTAPDIGTTLLRLEELAERYAQLCRAAPPLRLAS
jgi:hypothetical protein